MNWKGVKMKTTPDIVLVKPGKTYVVEIKFRREGKKTVDLSGMVALEKHLEPLRDEKIFRKMKVIDWGAAIGWPGDIALGASTLLHLANEQKPFTGFDFTAWQKRLGLSNQETADILQTSLGTIKNIRKSEDEPVAAPIAIACRAMEANRVTLAAHFEPRRTGRPKAA